MTRFLPGLKALTGAIPILVIAVLIYLISESRFTRHDLTEDRLYTLNDASIELLGELEETVHFKMYFSEELPPRFRPVVSHVKTIIAEYEARGNGKVKVSYIDPGADLELVDEAHKIGVYETKANVTEKSRVEMVYIWFGMAIFYEDRQEVFSSVQSVQNFEYDITSALVRLIRNRKPKVILAGPTLEEYGAGYRFDARENLKPVYAELSRQFDVEQIVISQGMDPKLDDADLVIAWGLPHYDPQQRLALDQYLMSGKSLMLLVSGVHVDLARMEAHALDTSEADDVYAAYGFTVNRDLVSDNRNTKIKYTDKKPPVLKEYPLYPALQGESLAKEEITLKGLKALVMPWASSLELLPGAKVAGQEIAWSSEQAWRQQKRFVIDPARLPGPSSFTRFPLAVAFRGRLHSAFANSDLAQSPGFKSQAAKDATLLVWGSEHLLTQANPSILTWFSQSAERLTSPYRVSEIDRKENAFRPIRALTWGEKVRIRWLSVTVVPALILFLAGCHMLYRRQRHRAAWLKEPHESS